ncbi:MAG: alpha-amylase/4-alpha-glucanotransferase domain-containing protein [Burkholderiales bacterium]
MTPTTLLLGVHAHQPVGNFPAVIDEAHERCYRPFLETLVRFPAFRFSAHFSGWLLDYLCDRYPGDMRLLEEMVRRGQVEMFGSGRYEPVLASIPHRDRLAQLEAMSDQLERRYGRRPEGAWLTERVWESSVVPSLVQTGIRYVVVDDYHFLASGRLERELDSFFTTEEDGERLDLFPISEALRYRFPFSPAPDAVRYLESLADRGRASAVYFDDIEKFGIWPETWDWVYGKRWLEDFIKAVLASDKIRTATFAEFHAPRATRGIVYLPTTSYIEMNEWTLGPGASETYAGLVREQKSLDCYETTKAFVRGGIWRNFFSRYPEANWMHKRMLGLSSRLAALGSAVDADAAELLFRAQANDAYWHGMFGGLYLPHLRRTLWSALVRLEALLDRANTRPGFTRADLDADGRDELFLATPLVQAVIRIDGQASLIELDSYLLGHNFGDTMRRTAEPYYAQIAAAGERHHGDGIASAHDRIVLKHVIDPADVLPDPGPRAMFIDSVQGADGIATVVANYAVQDPQIDRGVVFADPVLGIRKSYAVEANRITVRYQFSGEAQGVPEHGAFAVEINVAMPSADGYSGRYILADGSIPCGFGQHLDLASVGRVSLDDGELGGCLGIALNPPACLAARPHFAVSRSEAGFEKIMQAATLRFEWSHPVAGQALTIQLQVTPHADPRLDNNNPRITR